MAIESGDNDRRHLIGCRSARGRLDRKKVGGRRHIYVDSCVAFVSLRQLHPGTKRSVEPGDLIMAWLSLRIRGTVETR